MADIALLSPGIAAAPEGYTVPGAQEIILKAVTASFDGTDAVVPFVPTLQIIAPNGTVLASCPVPTTVAAGASADVSWFPRGGVGAGSSPGGGIEFNTDNEGGWLDITTRANGPGFFGMSLRDTEDNRILIDTDNNLLLNTEQNGSLLFGLAGGGAGGDGSAEFGIQAGQTFIVSDTSHDPVLEIEGAAALTVFVPLKVDGPTGATAATRYAGATAAGAPIAGTFEAGDFVIDQTGTVWVCTVSGSPGTWVDVGGAGGGTITDITSTDSSVTVTDPTGPTADLAVADSPAVGGVTITGTPIAGDVPLATGPTDAAWGAPPSATGIAFDTANSGGWLDVQTASADPTGVGISLLDTSGGGIQLNDQGGGGLFQMSGGGFQLFMVGSAQYVLADHLGNPLISVKEDGLQTLVYGTKIGLYTGSAEVPQHAAIPAPAGGVVVDTQARAAIVAILGALGTAAGGIGITA